MLQISHFSKSYDKQKKAVDDLTLEVAPGEIYGFIGHNGAGKTTTLRAVAGILPFEEGDIWVDSHSVKTEPIAAKKVTAYIPDNPNLYEFLTGTQYLNLIGDLYGISKEARAERAAKLADTFSLTANLGDPLSSYSHGMKQKAVLISAFMRQPKLLVLDEPFVGLDPVASHTLKSMFADHCQQGGSVFFSTHVLEVAQKLCHRIAILKQGKLVANGRTEDIVSQRSLEQVFLDLVEQQ